MTNQERNAFKSFAQAQITTLQVMIGAIEEAQHYEEQIKHSQQVIADKNQMLDFHQKRIEEDNATINIKDTQLFNAEKEIIRLNELLDQNLRTPLAAAGPEKEAGEVREANG
jgi:hypothetical protein